MKRIVRGGRLVAVSLRADRWRPASWLAVVAAAGAIGVISGVSPETAALPAAVAIGGLAAAAAIGDPPRGIAGPAAAWIAGRTAWPAVGGIGGVLLCAAIASGTPGESLSPMVAAAPASAGAMLTFAVGGMIAVAATFVRASRRGVASADAASLALVGVFATAGAIALLPDLSVVARGALALAAWTGMFGITVLGERLGAAGGEADVATLLGGAAMASTLAGMVVWLFLEPGEGVRYTLLANAWFAALALPQTALGCGSRDEALRQRLVPTARPQAWRTATFHAAVLGWPLVVAAGLTDDAALAVDRLLVAGLLVVTAAVAAASTVGVLAAGGSRETALAAVLGVGCLLIAAAVATVPARARPAGNDVEQFAPSCKTPFRSPDAAVPPA